MCSLADGSFTLEIGGGYVLSGFAVSRGVIVEVLSGGTVSKTSVNSGGTLELVRRRKSERHDRQVGRQARR
jgi:hypothetical protein